MEFRDVLAQRRMHRAFLPDAVPEESVELIVRTIRRAPSGGFSQGQSLVVVTDTDLRRSIAEALDEPGYVEMGSQPFISTAPLKLVGPVTKRSSVDCAKPGPYIPPSLISLRSILLKRPLVTARFICPT